MASSMTPMSSSRWLNPPQSGDSPDRGGDRGMSIVPSQTSRTDIVFNRTDGLQRRISLRQVRGLTEPTRFGRTPDLAAETSLT
jgi:hypothetical protein